MRCIILMSARWVCDASATAGSCKLERARHALAASVAPCGGRELRERLRTLSTASASVAASAAVAPVVVGGGGCSSTARQRAHVDEESSSPSAAGGVSAKRYKKDAERRQSAALGCGSNGHLMASACKSHVQAECGSEAKWARMNERERGR